MSMEEAPAPKYTVRELANHEYPLLAKVPPFDQFGIPDPETTRVVVAQDLQGQVIGFCFLHACLHVEPFGIVPEHEGDKFLARRLWDAVKAMMLQTQTKVAYAVIPDESLVVAGIAQKLGFHRIPAGLYWVETNPAQKPSNGTALNLPEPPKES